MLEQGGLLEPRTVDDFLRFVRLVVSRFGASNKRWLTFNEASLYTVMEVLRRRLGPLQLVRMSRQVVRAHRAAYDLIHELDPSAQVSSNLMWFGLTGVAGVAQRVSDTMFLESRRRQARLRRRGLLLPLAQPTRLHLRQQTTLEGGAAPAGHLRGAHAPERHAFPSSTIVIAENGMPTENGLPRADGHTRERVLEDTMYWVQRAVADGAPVTGYMYWSLTDNYEWGSYAPRFGLYTVDVTTDPTLARRPTAAVAAYRALIRNRGVPVDYRSAK